MAKNHTGNKKGFNKSAGSKGKNFPKNKSIKKNKKTKVN